MILLALDQLGDQVDPVGETGVDDRPRHVETLGHRRDRHRRDALGHRDPSAASRIWGRRRAGPRCSARLRRVLLGGIGIRV